MANFNERIQTGNDDGYNDPSFGWLPADADISTGKNFFGGAREVGLRFSGVTISVGSTITAATLTFTASNSDSNTVNTLVYGIAEDNTTSMSSDPTGRTKTTANVAWNLGSVTSGSTYVTADLTAIIQEIVDRGGWASGNALGFLIPDNGSSSNNIHSFYSYDGDSTKAVLLDITYTPGATTTSTSTTTTSTSTTSTSTSTTTLPPNPDIYGVKVFKANVDPSSTTPKNFFLNSHYSLLKIHKQGSFKGLYIRGNTTTITVNYPDLAYRPVVLVYCQRRNHDSTTDTNYHLLEWSYSGATISGIQRVRIYNNKFVLEYFDNKVDNDDVDNSFTFFGYYYVFEEEVRE